ncbi:hypothetical protein SAMN03159355_03109 [Pseudomonas sp. NFPP10]|uniref:hypothetical protein n=1 Tax=unclassified Pseudomonas TaxID=196821 RepID=UPI0008916A73|nr:MULTISPECIES: hypothetical protein [unclassified Pseudomonas]SDA25273.1 hypothetical protein SAMN03159465_03576 [Pseudomonas sp. NFPP12]SEL75695.1 hypothetical protein SAMN03159355_03109 [Pseudomonas sp. NFPP10]SFJ52251.1 hypothetical protein SAMN03159416_03525 [Pseudomonas sp. NFPP08]SFM90640.1 hypothetical protein SAMN03159476_03158 [Pseudomonas sp. NFPP05]SFX64127.1 hypothetical protein SAMN03159479_03109 [Pseudomonas sp. NFPP09]
MKWLPVDCCVGNLDILAEIIHKNRYLFSEAEHKLKIAYCTYISMEGSTEILPIKLSNEQIDFLRRAYSSRAKKYRLDWIDRLYMNKLLSCPMCGGEGPRTIDHYLPKEWYPEFAVLSYNLIPSCGTCNSKRGSYNHPQQPHPVLHPYFDADILSALIIYIDLSITTNVPNFTLMFNSYAFSPINQNRVAAHIRTCVDMTAFRSKCYGFMTEYRIAEKYNDQNHLNSYLSMRLEILEHGGNQNCWESALIRGIRRKPAVAAQIIAMMK